MGSKNCPETPRQKMISMMYLVLTAMLALNVAAETLYAFKIVDTSLMKTFESFSAKNKSVYSDFETAHMLNKDKVEPWLLKANDVRAKSDSLIAYITRIKEELVFTSGFEPHEPGQVIDNTRSTLVTSKGDTIIIKSQDDLNTPPLVMLTQGRGVELKQKINDYSQYLTSHVDSTNAKLIENIKNSLDVSDPTKGNNGNYRTWEEMNFYATPLIASITLLSKMQIDVRNAESALINYLYNQIDAGSFKFNKLEAQVIPKSKYVFQGESYEAEIFMSAVDTTRPPQVMVGGRQLETANNKAIYRVSATNVGKMTYNGYINFELPDGSSAPYYFTQEYQVAEPTVTISPTKMNMMYLSLDNPISISVPGVPSEDIEATITNGTIKKVGNGWVASPASVDPQGNTKVVVFANVDGKKRQMGEMKFRVRKVPDPRGTVAGKLTGTVDRQVLAAQTGVFASLEDFDFDLKFVVTSFDMAVPASGGLTQTLSSNSYRFTAEQKRLLNTLGAGAKVYIENIKARIEGDNKDAERTLAPIVLTVQ
jgi:gliding motility-associated protein GldM